MSGGGPDGAKSAGEVPIDERLELVRFFRAPEPHIELDAAICRRCAIAHVCVSVCPAGNYRVHAGGEVSVATESCMECGACRIACTEGSITWRWPRGGFGVHYVQG